jgi:hypothetical protein
MDDILYIVFYNLFEKDMLVNHMLEIITLQMAFLNRPYGSFKASTIYANKHILSIPIILKSHHWEKCKIIQFNLMQMTLILSGC